MVAEPNLYSSIFFLRRLDGAASRCSACDHRFGISALQQAGVTPHNAPQMDTNTRKKSAIDTKAVRIRDFDGTTRSWEGWAHSFKSAIRFTCPESLAMMEESEKSTTDATDEVLELDKFKDVDKISAEMFNIFEPVLYWRGVDHGQVGDDFRRFPRVAEDLQEVQTEDYGESDKTHDGGC